MPDEKKKSMFQPVPLCESFVNQFFDFCRATTDDPEEKYTPSVVFSTIGGYSKEEEQVFYFNKDKIEFYEKTLLYILGQLKCSLNTTEPIPVKTMNVKYNDKAWTKKPTVIMELLFLANAADLTSPVLISLNDSLIMSPKIIPTLSPNDPNFPEWWEEHKHEWLEEDV